MAGGGQYTIRVHGVLDDTQIRAQLAAIQKEYGFFGSKAGKGAGAYMASTGKGAKKGAQGMSAYIKGTEKATKSTKRFGQSTIDITKKVVQFGATTAVIRGVTSGMADMVNKTFELDSALTEYKKVSDLSGKSLEKYTDQAFKAGRQTARTGTEMIEAATQFKKMGYDDQMSMQLAKTASMFQNIADVEIDAGQAALFINSQLKAFRPELSKLGDEGTQAMRVIDGVNEVANNFGVGTNDLQLALSKTSSAMGGFGNSFSETIGIITAGTEVMVGQPSKVARGWRTIGANIAKVAKEADTYSAASGKVNIAMRNQNGEMKSTYEFLTDLHKEWGNLNDEEKQAIGIELAGKNHLEVFRATMDNFTTAIKANETAQNSQGSAARENARALESLQGHLQELKSAWSEFSNSIVKSEGLKKAMDMLSSFLRFLSTDAGHSFLGLAAGATTAYLALRPLFKLLSLSGAMGGAIKGFNVFAGAFGKSGKTLKDGSRTCKGAAKSFSGMSNAFYVGGKKSGKEAGKLGKTISKMSKSLVGAAPAIAGVTAVAGVMTYAIVKSYKEAHKYTDEVKDLTKANKEEVESLEENEKYVNTLVDEMERLNGVTNKTKEDKQHLKDIIDKLNELYPELGLKYDEETDKINNSTQAIRENIKARQEQAKAEAYQKGYEKSVEKQIKNEAKLKELVKERSALEQKRDSFDKADPRWKEYNRQLNEADQSIKNVRDSLVELSKEATRNENGMAEAAGNWDNIVKAYEETGAKIPESLSKGIEEGIYHVPDTLKELGDLIKFDEGAQVANMTRDGKAMIDALQQGMREGKISLSDALQIEQDFNELYSSMDGKGKKLVQSLIDDFNTGDINFDQFSQGLDRAFHGAEQGAKDLANTIPAAQQEIKNLGDELSVFPTDIETDIEIEESGGDEANKSLKDLHAQAKVLDAMKPVVDVVWNGIKALLGIEETEEGLNEVDGTTATAGVEVDGGEEAADQTDTVATGLSSIAGKVAQAAIGVVGAQEGASAVNILMGAISALTGKTVPVMETGAAPSAGRVRNLIGTIASLVGKTVTAKANTVGAGAVSSLKSMIAGLHNKTVSIVTKVKKIFSAKGTKNAPEGLSEVNEYGYEYIRDAQTGMLRVANGGKRGTTLLGKGDIVYTHGESMRMRQEAKEALPHFAKGKKSVSKKQYNKAIKKIRDKYEKELEKLEHKSEIEHWTDSEFASKKQELYNKFTAKIKKYNDTHKIKAKKKKDRKKKKGLGTDNKRSMERTIADVEHDTAIADIESRIEDFLGTEDNLKIALAKIQEALQAQKISADEAEELIKKAYKSNVDYYMKLLDKGEKTYDELAQIIEQYHEEGKISDTEYYEYLEDALDTWKDKYKDKMEELVDSFYFTVNKSGASIEDNLEDALAKLEQLRIEGKMTQEEAAEYEKQLYSKHMQQMFNAYQYDKRTYTQMRDLIEDYWKAGKLSAEEYYETLQDLADEAMDKEKKRLEEQKELRENEYDLAKAVVQLKVDQLEKENEQLEDQNELLELQADLEKAKQRRVRIYREGVGFVYEQDKEAIQEATSALQEFQKKQDSEELKQWKAVLELFDSQETLAAIRNLENLAGTTASIMMSSMGTNISAWTNWIKENLAESNGIQLLLNDMDKITYWDDVLQYLGGNGQVSQGNYMQHILQARYATGTTNATAGWHRVAENGYEMALLGKGDAVMPHRVSENLMEWGQMSPLEYAKDAAGAEMYNYSFDKLVLPNVHNADDFMRELKRLPNKAVQFSGGRV